MRLLDITATAHRDGNRIDLAWRIPGDAEGPVWVRAVRRSGSHPVDPDDGAVVGEGFGLNAVSDTGLQGETVFYYTLFPAPGGLFPPVFEPDPHNTASALALSPYGFAERMYALLPALYLRYDATRTAPPGTVPPADADKGQLRRFLDLPGGELDRIYSLTRAALALTDPYRTDDRLLPLLGDWIGWPVNLALPVAAQRNEIRHAPRLYQAAGTVPALDATVARVTGWPSSTKEYVHNVARTNQPERLNLWSAIRPPGGTAFAGPDRPVSLNSAYDGRPSGLRSTDAADAPAEFFFHTRKRHGFDIWTKRFVAGAWEASAPVVDRPGIDKYPSAARQSTRTWLFWQSCDTSRPAGRRLWQIAFSTRTGTAFAPPALFRDNGREQRLPAAVADGSGGLWLFWLERTDGVWQLRYNRHNGTAWQLAEPAVFPTDGGADPRVEDDLCALFRPGSTGPRLWLFWARREPTGVAGQTRWTLAHRSKQGLDPAVNDWSAVRTVPKTSPAYHDREPAALNTPDGNIELLWSSTQNGGWSLQRNTLAVTPLTWGANQLVVGGPYSRRGPAALSVPAGTLLLYGSNASVPYDSSTYGATHTLDHRYAGTTTVDTGAKAKLDLRGTFGDFQSYLYDTAQGGPEPARHRIARGAVGLFLTPGDETPEEIARILSRLAGVLPGFLPAATRPVLITPRSLRDRMTPS
ncbi:phage tail protein [Streptomyces sp. ODS28]|uniref:phage tail protein n=1 Tax=Streptomyces sp. ODS28 TaxID=3136688 RepID=UPI0031EEF74E